MANLVSIPIANVGVAYAQSQGAKKADPDWFNPWQRQFEIEEAREIMGLDVAKTLKKLVDGSKVPGWVTRQIDQKLLDRAISEG